MTNTNIHSQDSISIQVLCLEFQATTVSCKDPMTRTNMNRARPCLFQFSAKEDRKTNLVYDENLN